MKGRKLFVVTVAALLSITSLAFANDICQSAVNNLVVNCGFETADFTGWTQSGNTGVTSVSTTAPYLFSGSFGAQLGPQGSDGYLSQTLDGNTFSFQFRQDPAFWGLDSVVVAPIAYLGGGQDVFSVSFWLYSDGGTPNDFTVLWNGVDVGPDLVDSDQFAYTKVFGSLIGTGGPLPAPEPTSLALLGGGLTGLFLTFRRRLRRE